MHAILAILYYLTVAVGIMIFGIEYMIFCGIRGHWEYGTNVCHFFFKHIIFKMFRLTVSVEGAENIPKNRNGYVLIANHQSYIDTNVIWHSIARAAFLAKASLWGIPVFHWVMNHIGCIPVYKNARKNAGMGKLLQSRLEQGYNIAVFPEGHRSKDDHMAKFQNGIFRMAKEHHFDILPITLVNTGKHLPKVKWAFYPGEIKVVVHPLVKAEDYANKPMAEFRDEMHDLIESALPYKQVEKDGLNADSLSSNSADKEA